MHERILLKLSDLATELTTTISPDHRQQADRSHSPILGAVVPGGNDGSLIVISEAFIA